MPAVEEYVLGQPGHLNRVTKSACMAYDNSQKIGSAAMKQSFQTPSMCHICRKRRRADPRLLVPRPCAPHRDTQSAHAMGGAVLQCFLKFKKWRGWRHHHQTLIRASLRCLHVENEAEMRLSSIRVSLHAIARCRTVLCEMPRSQRGATFCRA